MMYRHNVMVLNELGEIVQVIDDEIDPSSYGLEGPVVRGSPVEAAVAPDGRHVYVSNYKLYGPGYRSDADDDCDAGDWEDSLVFRIDTETLAIDGAVAVGAVPKFMAVTPDGRLLLVANWCGFDVSVIDLASFTEVTRLPVGRHPRGLAISADSSTAYVAVMGAGIIRRIDIASLTLDGDVDDAGPTPRHLVLSDDDQFLFVTNNYGDTVRRIDLTGRESPVVRSVPSRPRTMVASDDGSTLYVVSYDADLLTVLRAADLDILQQLTTGDRPIGVTVEERTRSVWVANYSGSLMRFALTGDAQ
jgi:YVTN family beta-propeller protein